VLKSTALGELGKQGESAKEVADPHDLHPGIEPYLCQSILFIKFRYIVNSFAIIHYRWHIIR
jgi:hypothetical protein